MQNLKKLNYYERLHVSPRATLFEIKRAYVNSLALYADDSLATYSLFTDTERQAILDLLETAFRTLGDTARRTAYDQALVDAGLLDPTRLSENPPNKPVPLFGTPEITRKAALTNSLVLSKNSAAAISRIARDMAAAEVISGRDLKNVREKVGLTPEEIYEATRISISTIRAIEADDFKNLPSTLYLKNFLRAYASLVNLDPQMVATGYLKNREEK